MYIEIENLYLAETKKGFIWDSGGSMAKKRKTLPKEMRALLESGDITAAKEQFLRCEPNAVTGKYGSNIFSL